MRVSARQFSLRYLSLLSFLALLVLGTTPALSQEYEALEGVDGLKTVFDYTHGSPEAALVIFQAMRDVYQSKSVTSRPNPPATVIVFHDAAVNLILTERTGNEKKDETLDKVAEMIRQFKKDGVKMEVCMFAVNVIDVDPDLIMPEIEKVPNGFVAVSGWQARGYSLIAVP